MAAELVGGAFLSASLQVIFDRLSSHEFLNLIRAKKLNEKLLGRLKTTIYAASAVLNDAEYKQINDPAVKNWLDDLREAVYVADDLLDEFSTRVATHKEVSKFSRYLKNFNGREIGSKIEDITCTLESIVKDKDILDLKESKRKSWCMRRPSTSLVDASEIYGRDKDKEAVISLLLDDSSERSLSGIAIVGMGGMGKTTLAQLVYNDDQIQQKFDLKAWVCVSEEFNVSKVTKTIIEAVTSGVCNMEGLNLLQLCLKEQLLGKKFFLVLDDVWNESYADWDLLQKPFRYGRKGSKILVTTRSERVSAIVRTIPRSYQLDELSDDNCWLLFAKHSRLSIDCAMNSDLAKIGRDIVRKCKRLPLAIKLLGGLLGLNHDIQCWKTVLKSDIWDLPEKECEIFPALRISYHYLPPHLKQCFAYCSLFPKEYEFDKEELILLWMAEGFLQSANAEITMEEVGSVCFNILTARSFLQHSSKRGLEFRWLDIGRIRRRLERLFVGSIISVGKFINRDHHKIISPNDKFFMHDLIHDLSIYVGGKFFHNLEVDNGNKIPGKTRHLSCDVANINVAMCGVEMELLRTLVMKKRDSSQNMITTHIDTIMLSKCLRVLSICGFEDLRELPDSIGELIHLRYLDLSSTSIERLPESLCKLYNLQTLKLLNCQLLTMLPNNMQNLINLRYLDISRTHIREMPRGIGKLENLQFLSDFVISKDQGAKIGELGKLPCVGLFLGLWNLEYVRSADEALEAKMMEKSCLQALFFEWSHDDNTMDSHNEREILDKLQPHSNLKRLTIDGYRGTSFPDWLGLSLYHSIVYLHLQNCKNCWILPPLGQLHSLKELIIEGFDNIMSIGADFYKTHDSSSETDLIPFASLEYLEIGFMLAWENWYSHGIEAFPKLQKLIIYDCPKLTGDLPKNQQHLALQIEGCPSLLRGCIPRSVEHLTIADSCDSLPSFQTDTFSNLKHLEIIGVYDSVKCFPEDGLLTASLSSLKLTGISSLETVNCEVFRHMTSLEQVSFCGCSKLEKMAVERLAACVTSRIIIEGCPLIQPEELSHLSNVHVWSA